MQHGTDHHHRLADTTPRLHPLMALAGWLLLVFTAAALGALGSRDAAQVYGQLNLPPWAPPAVLFGPVWTVLYALMAVAAWLVGRTPGGHRGAYLLFGAQLAANVLWSWCFFAWRSGGLAMLDIVVLLGLIVATIAAFMRVRASAGVLLLPYLAWVTFAAVLTWAVWQGNPAML